MRHPVAGSAPGPQSRSPSPATAKGGPALHIAPAIVRWPPARNLATSPAAARMTDNSDGKRDFFVSFSQADREWATWIAWVLEENRHSVFFQDWDFRGSFIEQMHQAALRSKKVLVVLS